MNQTILSSNDHLELNSHTPAELTHSHYFVLTTCTNPFGNTHTQQHHQTVHTARRENRGGKKGFDSCRKSRQNSNRTTHIPYTNTQFVPQLDTHTHTQAYRGVEERGKRGGFYPQNRVETAPLYTITHTHTSFTQQAQKNRGGGRDSIHN